MGWRFPVIGASSERRENLSVQIEVKASVIYLIHSHSIKEYLKGEITLHLWTVFNCRFQPTYG